jgi:hypothetical protein
VIYQAYYVYSCYADEPSMIQFTEKPENEQYSVSISFENFENLFCSFNRDIELKEILESIAKAFVHLTPKGMERNQNRNFGLEECDNGITLFNLSQKNGPFHKILRQREIHAYFINYETQDLFLLSHKGDCYTEFMRKMDYVLYERAIKSINYFLENYKNWLLGESIDSYLQVQISSFLNSNSTINDIYRLHEELINLQKHLNQFPYKLSDRHQQLLYETILFFDMLLNDQVFLDQEFYNEIQLKLFKMPENL